MKAVNSGIAACLHARPGMAQLPRQLARDNPNFRSLWEEGYVAEKQVAITQSAAHSYHLSIGNVKKHTLWQPCPLNTFVKLDAAIADDAVAEFTFTWLPGSANYGQRCKP